MISDLRCIPGRRWCRRLFRHPSTCAVSVRGGAVRRIMDAWQGMPFPAKLFRKRAASREAPAARACRRQGSSMRHRKSTHHVIDNAHRLADRSCLEPHARVPSHQLVDGDGALCVGVEVNALHLARIGWHGLGGLQDSIGGPRGSLRRGRLIGRRHGRQSCAEPGAWRQAERLGVGC